MPYIDSHGNLVDKPQGILQGYEIPGFFGIFGGIITFIAAFFQSLFAPLMGLRKSADNSKPPKRGGGDWRPPGGGGGGGGGPGNRRFGRLNNSAMDMSSCPTSGG
uniref:Selenoprotein K n=1 Tax=Panagrolaimus superbus TaxID=310955 RepID=A0A914ZB17_9BILA